jgi:hypothetical protein
VLQGLAHLDHGDFEVIVVVGPDDAGIDRVRAAAPAEVRWLTCAERNVAMSRNIGVAAARGALVAFIDDDAVPDPAWLCDLEAGFADPEIAVVGGPVFDRTGARFQAFASLVSRSGRVRELRADGWLPGPGFSSPESWLVPFAMGTNACMRREALIEVGGFDERFAYFHDDTDVCVRLCDRGHRVALLDRGFVHHGYLASGRRDESGTVTDWSQILTSTFYFAARHGSLGEQRERSRKDVEAYVAGVRAAVAREVADGSAEPRGRARVEGDIAAARDIAARYACEVAGGHRAGGLAAGAAAADPGPGHGRFPSWGARLAEAGRSPLRSHVCLGGDDDSVRARACRMAREDGAVVRVLRAGGDQRTVAFDGWVWHHTVPPDGDPEGALLAEVRRVDAMRPVDRWVPRSGA